MNFNALSTRIAGLFLFFAILSCQKEQEALPEPEKIADVSAQVQGTLTWYLVTVANPTADQQDAYNRITAAMNAAVAMYNAQTPYCSGTLRVEYNTSVATADGNVNGTIRFGSNRTYMTQCTAQHEIAHTQGVGTTTRWSQLVVSGKFTGAYTLAMLRTFPEDGPNATLSADGHSFWPYGLNYNSEWTTLNGQRNAILVGEMQRDGV